MLKQKEFVIDVGSYADVCKEICEKIAMSNVPVFKNTTNLNYNTFENLDLKGNLTILNGDESAKYMYEPFSPIGRGNPLTFNFKAGSDAHKFMIGEDPDIYSFGGPGNSIGI